MVKGRARKMAIRTKLFLLTCISMYSFIVLLFISYVTDMRIKRLVKPTWTNSSVQRANSEFTNQSATSSSRSLSHAHVHEHHEGHDGFELGMSVHNICQASGTAKISSGLREVFSIPSKRLTYCPVEKIGTTYWRRLFYMLLKPEKKYENPYDVTIKDALDFSKLFSKKIRNKKEADVIFQNSFSVLIVRNPYSRLLSAFVDKLLPPNPTYWKGFGVKAIKAYRNYNKTIPVDGHDVTFAEFVRHVVESEKTGKNLDVHYMSIMRSCRPCQFKFDYIGKMETFQSDAVFILDKMGINTSVDSIKNRFRELSIDDAIEDSIYSPFSWKKDILKSITWEKALQRIWLKLQLRGIIAMEKTLTLTEEVLKMNASTFVDLARKSHRDSNPESLKMTNTLAKKEAFASVPIDILKQFREVFHNDFHFFGYDDSPPYVFDRSDGGNNTLFNYSHLN